MIALHRARTNWANECQQTTDYDKQVEAGHYEQCLERVIALLELIWPQP